MLVLVRGPVKCAAEGPQTAQITQILSPIAR